MGQSTTSVLSALGISPGALSLHTGCSGSSAYSRRPSHLVQGVSPSEAKPTAQVSQLLMDSTYLRERAKEEGEES